MPKYILFDTETTGNGESDRIIQVGAILIHDKNTIEVFDELCQAPVDISYEAMEVHGIVPEMLQGRPPFNRTRFARMLQNYNASQNFLIAHNIGFDLEMIKKEGFEPYYTVIDTLRCSRHLFEELPNHRLQYLRYALGIYHEEEAEAERLGVRIKAHEAIGDVLILKLLLSKLIERIKERHPSEHPMKLLAELTHKPVLIKKFRFGKYKDRLIEEIAREDTGYLHWMRDKLDLDEDMRYSLDYYLN